ncbi:MAG: hypothetical protein HUK22_07825, partial [Thermoguttaceae bacterium]|nr:hypothetical protein [Thermoguttaceae bacterium]
NLTVTCDVETLAPGSYSYSAALLDADGNVVDMVVDSAELEAGTRAFTFEFDGLAIFQSQTDGPYTIELNFLDCISRFSVYTAEIAQTAAYSFTEFEGAQAIVSGPYADRGEDFDEDGASDALVFDVGVNVAVAGSYRLVGYLEDEAGVGCGYADVYADLLPGAATVSLEFDARTIVSYAQSGAFTLSSLMLVDDATGRTLQSLNGVYTTASYDLNAFHQPAAFFAGEITVETPDSDSDRLFDSLVFNIPYSVAESGAYLIFGSILNAAGEQIGVVDKTVYVDPGEHVATMTIDGAEIREAGVDGAFRLVGLSISNDDGTLAYGGSFTSEEYLASQFEHRTLSVGYATDAFNADTDCIEVAFTAVSEIAGRFGASARLVDVDGNEIGRCATDLYLSANKGKEFVLQFDFADAVENGVNGPFYVCDFSFYNTRNTDEYLNFEEFHETQAYSVTPNVPEWDLADYSYADYVLDATPANHVTAILYGVEADGALTELKAWDYVGAGANAVVAGVDERAESLTVTAAAAAILGTLDFNGD